MDGQTKFLKIAALKSELHSDECTDARAVEILTEIRNLNAAPKPKRRTKEREQYMTVLGGYVLDMHNHGLLIGTRDQDGNIIDRQGKKTGAVVALEN